MWTKVYAQTGLGTIGGTGLGPFGTIGSNAGPTSGLAALTNVVSNLIGVMTLAASIWFLFQFLVGGFYWITSGGDKQRLHEAKERIQNAFIGFIIVIAGWAVLALVGQFLGYDTLVPDSVMNTFRF